MEISWTFNFLETIAVIILAVFGIYYLVRLCIILFIMWMFKN